MRDWVAWHEAYADPASPLTARLAVVQTEVRRWLATAREGDLRVLSACAGLGLDLIDVLAQSPRSDQVSALLVEWDAELSTRSRELCVVAGLPRVVAAQGDAGLAASYAGAVPADLVLLCGVFGNVSDDDIRATIRATPSLCADGATVVWTRHRRSPDATPWIRAAWAAAGFEEVAFSSPGPEEFSVGTCRLLRPPEPFDPSLRLFTFA
ncbi:MAG: hypothetical protein JWO12_924 [Frankiales bacterium]|nr:hypothetical protein [Frankiales bacterium]